MNPTNSEKQKADQRPDQRRLGYDSAVDEAERRLLSVTQAPTVDCSRLRTTPQEKSLFEHNNGETTSLLVSQQEPSPSASNLRDINAMSVASIYDRESNDIMDADK